MTAAVPCILPEQILEFLIDKCDLKIDEQTCYEYWQHLELHDDAVALESKRFRQLQEKEIWPIGIHGDEANIGIISQPYSKVIGMTLSIPVYRPKSTRISRYLMFALESSTLVDVVKTVNPILRRIADSLNKCTESGILGRKFILTELRGDQAWFYFLLQHKARWTSANICFRCSAHTRPDQDCYALYDAGSTNRRSTREFIIEELPTESLSTSSEITSVPIFINFANLMFVSFFSFQGWGSKQWWSKMLIFVFSGNYTLHLLDMGRMMCLPGSGRGGVLYT